MKYQQNNFLSSKLQDLFDFGQSTQADLQKSFGLRGDLEVKLIDLEDSQELLFEEYSSYIDEYFDNVDRVLENWRRNASKRVQPSYEPHWFADYGYQEDPGYFKCQLDRLCCLLHEVTVRVAETDLSFISSMNRIYEESVEPVIEVDCPSEGEALLQFLRDTVDKQSADQLLTLFLYTEDLFENLTLGLKDYLTAKTVILDRLNRRCRPAKQVYTDSPDLGDSWLVDLDTSKKALKGLKCFDNPPGMDETHGSVPMLQDAFCCLLEAARAAAGPWATEDDVMVCMEELVNQE